MLPAPHFPLLRSLGGGYFPKYFEMGKELKLAKVNKMKNPVKNLASTPRKGTSVSGKIKEIIEIPTQFQ